MDSATFPEITVFEHSSLCHPQKQGNAMQRTSLGKKLVKRQSGKLFCGQTEIWNSYWKTWTLCPPGWGREGQSDLLSELSAGVACLHSRLFINRKPLKHHETRNITGPKVQQLLSPDPGHLGTGYKRRGATGHWHTICPNVFETCCHIKFKMS